nr:cation-transporting P-type ATPase [Methanobacterium spitsbergense]
MKELLSKLSSNKNGLSVQEANQRLQKYGPNEIIEKKQILLLNLLDIFGVLYHGLLK